MSGPDRGRPEPDEILAGIAEVAREHLDCDRSLAWDARLVEDLGLDSVRLLTLAVEVENRFRVCLEPSDERAIVTVGDLVQAIERRLRERATTEPDESDGEGPRGEREGVKA